MGVNLNDVGHLLGINRTQTPTNLPGIISGYGGGTFDSRGRPVTIPDREKDYVSAGLVTDPGVTPNALLGQGPVEEPAQDEIVAEGVRNPTMSAETMGMPSLLPMRSPDPAEAEAIRQQLKEKAEFARSIYHKKSEFGTKGILRDVIGNASDFGRRLLGFAPRYNEEKWAERAYGMTSADPKVRAAALEQAMQYNPQRTQEYLANIDNHEAKTANTGATVEYKRAQSQQRQAQILSGLGSSLFNQNMSLPAEVQQSNYERMRPVIQKAMDDVYGPGVMQTPDVYDNNFGYGLSKLGYSGSNVQREGASQLSADTQKVLGRLKADTQLRVQKMRGESQQAAARILADSRMTLAQKEQELKLLPVEETTVEEVSGSIVRPTTKTTRTKEYAPNGQRGAKTVTRTGRDASGRRVVQYSDGSVDFAN